jgi:hypothetical protein
MHTVEPLHPLFEVVFTHVTDEMSITRIGLLERQLSTLAWWYWISHSRCVAAVTVSGRYLGCPFSREHVMLEPETSAAVLNGKRLR